MTAAGKVKFEFIIVVVEKSRTSDSVVSDAGT